MKTIILTLFAALSLSAQAQEIKITNSTKKILPTIRILQFEEIDWWKIKKESAQNVQKNRDSNVMQCDDGYYERAEITTTGTIGEDVKIINRGCEFIGHWTDGYRTVLHFGHPKDGDSCEIEVQKTDDDDDGKPLLRKFWFEIHSAC